MQSPTFEELKPQDVRNYWKHEEREFTPWLADEIAADGVSHLEDVLGLDLEVVAREKSVGRYNVDIFAEVVDDGRNVVIENQLTASDHDHLGKSLAYAAGVDADIIVWIAPKFNDEHRDAFQWLNSNSRKGVNLFAVRLEVWRIGESPPAVRFNPVEEPSEWKELAKRSEGELSDTKQLQEQFWTAFRDRIESTETPLRPRKPKPQHWYNNPIGRSGFTLSFSVNTEKNTLYCGLVIRDDAQAYQELVVERDAIESEFDETLVWKEPEETRAGNERSKILTSRSADLTEQARWDEYLTWLLHQGEQFHETFYDRIQSL
ncbi:DUF4268 domain-containing protein [Haladaptatus pallidirubidus]|uniref:DUF4268 domain-containing protein n=2 Tax=Haladaptatus pallidirubidus TaxID=1008152 RepID=A0AAV3UIY6_9EURY